MGGSSVQIHFSKSGIRQDTRVLFTRDSHLGLWGTCSNFLNGGNCKKLKEQSRSWADMGGWGLVTGSLELRIQSWPTGASTNWRGPFLFQCQGRNSMGKKRVVVLARRNNSSHSRKNKNKEGIPTESLEYQQHTRWGMVVQNCLNFTQAWSLWYNVMQDWKVMLLLLTKQTPPPHAELSLEQWFSTGDDFVPQGTLGNVWRYFWLSWLEWVH